MEEQTNAYRDKVVNNMNWCLIACWSFFAWGMYVGFTSEFLLNKAYAFTFSALVMLFILKYSFVSYNYFHKIVITGPEYLSRVLRDPSLLLPFSH